MWPVRSEKATKHGVLTAIFESLCNRFSFLLARSIARAQARLADTPLSRWAHRQRTMRTPPSLCPPPKVAELEFPCQRDPVYDEYSEHMMNVSRLWDIGILGKGVISWLADDRLDYESDGLSVILVRRH